MANVSHGTKPSRRWGPRRVILANLLVAIAAYLIWGRIEAWKLARTIAEIQQRGEPISLDDGQAVSLTDEQRLSARLYAAAVERVEEVRREEGVRFHRMDVDQVPPVANLAELEATYRKDAPALQLLDQATPLDFNGFGTLAPEFATNQSPLESLGALNALRADLLSRRNDGDGAAAALVASVRLLRAIPLAFYRYQADSRILGSLRILLRRASPGDASLLTLQQAFERLPDEDGLPREMINRRARFLQDIRHARRSMTEAALLAVFHPVVANFTRRQLAAFGETIEVARQPFPAKLDAAAALMNRYPAPAQWRNRGWLRDLIEQGPPTLALGSFSPQAAALDLATRRVAITALALERYRRAHAGAAPPALDALVPAFIAAVPQDPFSGKPLVYKQDAGSYMVYSVDANRADDGGALYGLGAMTGTQPRDTRSQRDYGIRVPLTPLVPGR